MWLRFGAVAPTYVKLEPWCVVRVYGDCSYTVRAVTPVNVRPEPLAGSRCYAVWGCYPRV